MTKKRRPAEAKRRLNDGIRLSGSFRSVFRFEGILGLGNDG